MNNKELIAAFLNSIVEESYYETKAKSGSDIYLIKYLKLIIANKNEQSLDLIFSDNITVKVFFEDKDSKPITRYYVNGNKVSRVINEANDFSKFLKALPLSKNYLQILNRDENPKRTYNKIIISNAILKKLNKCDMVSVSYEGKYIGFTLKGEVNFSANIKPISGQKCRLLMTFIDNALYQFDRTPPKGKDLSLEEKRKVVSNDYSRGIDVGYDKEIVVDDHYKACDEINSFFENGHDILRDVRRKAGYIN